LDRFHAFSGSLWSNGVFHAGGCARFFGTLLFLALGGGLRLPRSPLLIAIAAYIVVRLVAGFFGENAGESFWGDQMRMTGTIFWLHVLVLLALIAVFFSRETIRRLVAWAAAFGGGVAALAWLTRLANIFPELGVEGRLFGTFGNPIFFANFLVIQVFLALFLVVEARGWRKPLWAAIALLDAVTLFFTESRGALLGLLAGLVIFFFGAVFLGRDRKLRWVATGGAVLFSGVLAMLFVFRASPFLTSVPAVSRLAGFEFSQILTGTGTTRILFWKIAWRGFLARPLLGWGPENFDIVFDRFYNPKLVHFSFYETWADRPHNTILETLATTGLLGVAAYLSIFVVAGYLLVRGMQRKNIGIAHGFAIMGALAAFLAAGAFSFETPGALMLLFLFFAWVTIATAVPEKQRAMRFTLDPALRVVSVVTLTLSLTLTIVFVGIRPLLASHAAAVSGNALSSGALQRYEDAFRVSLQLPTPYRDEILIILADDFLKADARGVVSRETLGRILPQLVAAMERSVALRPNRFAIVYRLGQVQGLAAEYIDRKYVADAERSFAAAAALSQGRQVVPIARAQVFLAVGEAARAEEIIRELLATDAEFAKAHWLLGLVLLERGETKAGREEIHNALKLGVSVQTVRERLLAIDVYTEAQEFEPIVFLYQYMIAADPKNPDWHARLAATYASLGKKKEALNEVTRAVELDPSYREDAERFLKIIDVLPD